MLFSCISSLLILLNVLAFYIHGAAGRMFLAVQTVKMLQHILSDMDWDTMAVLKTQTEPKKMLLGTTVITGASAHLETFCRSTKEHTRQAPGQL